jgi:hypothetical protein
VVDADWRRLLAARGSCGGGRHSSTSRRRGRALTPAPRPALPPPLPKGGTKPATLETGATINVPLFIESGEVIKIDTRTDTYIGRSKE